MGHFRNQCKTPKKNKNGQYNKKTVNATTDDIGDALVLSVSSPLESWVLDSGASFHSCSDAEIMENYVSGEFGQVYLAEDEPLKIVGKGDVRISTPNGSILRLNGVRHIPGLKRNLLQSGSSMWRDTQKRSAVAVGRSAEER